MPGRKLKHSMYIPTSSPSSLIDKELQELSCVKNEYSDKSSASSSYGKRKIERRKRRKNVTVKSIIIKPLQNDFIQGYMFSDGLILPKGATNVSSFVPNNEDDNYNNGNDDESWADDLSSSENHDEKDINVDEIKEKENQGKEGNQTNNHQNQQYFFPELNESITKAIKSLGGKVA